MYVRHKSRILRVLFGIFACAFIQLSHASEYQVGQYLGNLNDLGRYWYTTNASSLANAPYASTALSTIEGTDIVVAGRGSLAVAAGRNAAITVATRVPLAEVAAGAARIMGGPLGVAVVFGMPYLLEWLNKSDIQVVGTGPATKLQTVRPGMLTTYYTAFYFQEGMTAAGACHRSWIAIYGNTTDGNDYVPNDAGTRCEAIRNLGNDLQMWHYSVPGGTAQTIDIAPKDMPTYLKGQPNSGNILPEVLDKGGYVTPGTSSVTGPSSTPTITTTTTNADGTTTTTNDVTNLTYNGNTVTTTNNTTNNNFNPVTNTTTTTSTTTTAPVDAKAEDFCIANPDRAGCAKLGNPIPDTIKKTSNAITVTPVIFASSSACPAPLSFTVRSSTYSVGYTPLCDRLAMLKYLFLAMAAFLSAWILADSFKV